MVRREERRAEVAKVDASAAQPKGRDLGVESLGYAAESEFRGYVEPCVGDLAPCAYGPLENDRA